MYGPGVTKEPTKHTQCHDQYALEQVLDVPNPFYKEFRDPKSVANSDQGSCCSFEQDDVSGPRLNTFPYVMDDNENSKLGTLQQKGDRIKDIVYECVDTSCKPSSTIAAETCTRQKCERECDNENTSKASTLCSNVQASQLVDLYDDILTSKTTFPAQAKYYDVTMGAGKGLSSNSLATLKASESNHLKCAIQIQEEAFNNESFPAIKQQPSQFDVDDAGYANTG